MSANEKMVMDPPVIRKGFEYVTVLILVEGEESYSEALYGKDGFFRYGYDEPAIDDVELWMDLPKRFQPAQQGQGEPAAYLPASDLERLAQPHVAGCAASLAKSPRSGFVAIYTHADPAEVSKWRNEAHRFNLEVEQQKNLIESLRAELVESYSIEASAEPSAPVSFQARVQPWLMECFGEMIAGDREERNHRFLEEALELVQALGTTATEAHQLVDYVFGREVGEPGQEVGGVMVTLAALCLANGLDMHHLADTELARVWTKVEQIRAKQATKPQFGPLPGVYPDREPSAPVEIDERAEFERHVILTTARPIDSELKRHPIRSEEYECRTMHTRWLDWQARAALERKP